MSIYGILNEYGARVGGYVSLDDAPKRSVRGFSFPAGVAVLPFTVPYFCGDDSNLAIFAAAADYHAYFALIGERLKEYVFREYGERYCRVLADVSPFDEVRLGAMGDLGIIGDHGLLIDPEYSSFVFIGEAVLGLDDGELRCEGVVPASGEIRYCNHCGACRRACPTGGIDRRELCLSAVTQKKGELSENERRMIGDSGAVWGCDRCALVCPLMRPVQAPVPYFTEGRLGRVTCEQIAEMSDGEYSRYPFSWRKREVIIRNLRICEELASRRDTEKR